MSKAPPPLTPRQAQWFQAVREGLEKDTDRSLEDWAALVKQTCPETAHKKRLEWLKANHGLGQNRASTVLDAAFGAIGWDNPDALADALWQTPNQRALLAALNAALADWDGLIVTQRKGYTAFSKSFQFAALSPAKPDGARLGLALAADADARLMAPKAKESWSERLRAVVPMADPTAIDAHLITLLRRAYDAS